jgi:hypothetical protein
VDPLLRSNGSGFVWIGDGLDSVCALISSKKKLDVVRIFF